MPLGANAIRHLLGPLMGGCGIAAAAAAALAADVSPEHVLIGVAGVIAGIAALYLVWQIEPAYTLTGALLLTCLSGYWDRVGVPGVLSPDRLLLIAGAGAAILRASPEERRRVLRLQPVHVVLIASILYVGASAARAGTLDDQGSLFKLIQAFGVLPFIVFAVAPLAFRNERDRRVLLAGLVALGGYLGVTALFEAARVYGPIFPRYIADPDVGIHFGHARGPFVQAAVDGFALYLCAVAAMIARSTWTDTLARFLALTVTTLCLAGALLTLQRAVWVALVVTAIVAICWSRPLRRTIVPAMGVAVAAAAALVLAVPDVRSDFDSVLEDSENVRSRQITNAAAVDMLEAQPLTGVGWDRYHAVSPRYLVQGDDYPLVGDKLNQVHNLYLSYAADLGLIGVGLWVLGLGMAVGGALLTRGPPQLLLWRQGLVLILLFFAAVAAFTPSSAAFPILGLWLWIGVVWAGRFQLDDAPAPAR